MYLRECLIENVGPIEFIDRPLPFNDDGTPQPLVLVGRNGSGKSIFLSYIVDALTEFAKIAYLDIVSGQQSNFSPYFKLTGGTNQRVNSKYGIGLLEFCKNDINYSYIDKSGNLEPNTYNEKIRGRFQAVQSWSSNENQKLIAPQDKKSFEDFFRENAVCYFPPSRKEIPHWLNRDSLSDEVKFIIEQKFATKLGKPIFIESSVQENKSWLLDVFLDSLIDFEAVTPDDATQRYLVLEHYFSDNLLKEYNKYGKNILETEIFTISGDKNSFAAKVDSFDVLEFENFKVLFEKLKNYFQRWWFELIKKSCASY